MNNPNTCKRGCCWTPHGVCARQHSCSHHVHEKAERQAKEARDSLAREVANFQPKRTAAQAWSS